MPVFSSLPQKVYDPILRKPRKCIISKALGTPNNRERAVELVSVLIAGTEDDRLSLPSTSERTMIKSAFISTASRAAKLSLSFMLITCGEKPGQEKRMSYYTIVLDERRDLDSSD